MKRANLKHTIVDLGILFVVVTACRASAPATPLPLSPDVPAPTLAFGASFQLNDRALCDLTAPETDSPWRQYWRSWTGRRGGVRALLLDGNWLWAGTPKGLARLNLQTLDCALWQDTDTYPGMSLAHVHALTRSPDGCLWAANSVGITRHCADASDGEPGWQPVLRLEYPIHGLGFDAKGNLWIFRPVGGRGKRAFVRYEGHEPPLEGEWQHELTYRPPEGCSDWFSHSHHFYKGQFQSLQECQTLLAWTQRLALLELPAGMKLVESFASPLTTDGDGVWLFARQSGAVADQYFLLRSTNGQPDSNDWLVTPWPFAPPHLDTVMVADKTRSGVWIGSRDGLVFSDGQTIQRMPLTASDLIPTGPPILDLTSDQAGRLWAATPQGLLRYDAEADHWQQTAIFHQVLITPDDQGGLWAISRSAGGYVSHFDGEHWRHHSSPRHCRPTDITADAGGGLWMTSFDCDLHGFDGQRWTPYGGSPGIRGALLARAPGGEVYAAGRNGLIQRYDGVNWETLPEPDPQGPSQTASALAVDRRGGLWVGYYDPPYLRHFDGDRWHAFSDSVTKPLYFLLTGSQDDVWMMGNGVLLHYDGKDWDEISTGDFSINALAEDRRGRIWAGGADGLYVFDPAAWVEP